MVATRKVGYVPKWTRKDRLRKARAETGLTTRDFALEIGVSQKTVTTLENNDSWPLKRIVLNAWAMRTGVSAEWLERGDVPGNHPGSSVHTSKYALLKTA